MYVHMIYTYDIYIYVDGLPPTTIWGFVASFGNLLFGYV